MTRLPRTSSDAPPRAVNLQAVTDDRGTLCIADCETHVSFTVHRIFYITGMKPDTRRGDHAHRRQAQFLSCPSGAVDLDYEWAGGKGSVRLGRPDMGFYAPPMTWLSIRANSAGSVCLVLASDRYDEADYIRDHAEFSSLLAREAKE